MTEPSGSLDQLLAEARRLAGARGLGSSALHVQHATVNRRTNVVRPLRFVGGGVVLRGDAALAFVYDELVSFRPIRARPGSDPVAGPA